LVRIARALSSKSRAGRPIGSPLLDDKLIRDVERFLKAGNFFEVTIEALGIGRSTGYQWLDKGRDLIGVLEKGERSYEDLEEGERRYVDFTDAVMRASARAETNAVSKLSKGMSDDPRIVLEFLKRRYPDRWGDRIKHDGGGGENLNLNQLIASMVRGIADRALQQGLPAGEPGEDTSIIDAEITEEQI
jgi:hypothetical protein